MAKTRDKKQKEYEMKYGHIPLDFNERLNYMYDLYNLSYKDEIEIINKRNKMINDLRFYDIDLILYQLPEGTPRPRFRIVNRKNFIECAQTNPQFVHVYNLYAHEDSVYMQRLVNENLTNLNTLIYTPISVEFNTFLQTPKYYNKYDTFLSELGLEKPITKPDWDNLGKKYSDMSNHNIWLDDQLVVTGKVDLFYSILPRIEIKIRYLNMVYNKYQYRSIINRKDYNKETMNLKYFGG